MKSFKLILGILVVGALGFWGYRTFFPSDERVIRHMLQEAAEAASINPDNSRIMRLASVSRLLGMCTEDIRVVVEGNGSRDLSVDGRDRLREALTGIQATVNMLDIELVNMRIEVEADGRSAVAHFVARISTENPEEEAVQEFRTNLRKAGDDWKFALVQPLDSLSM